MKRLLAFLAILFSFTLTATFAGVSYPPPVSKLTTSDALNDMVVSGLLGSVPGSGLVLNIPSGVVILGGNRLSISASGNHTYTASKDTYVDLSSAAVFVYTAVSNGASAPALAAGSLRLEKVVTNGTDITSIKDLRPTWISSTKHVRLGFYAYDGVQDAQPDNTFSFYIDDNLTSAPALAWGMKAFEEDSPAADGATFEGWEINAETGGTHTFTRFDSMYAYEGLGTFGTGNVTTANDMLTASYVGGTVVVTNLNGVHVNTPTKAAGATITNNTGVKIEDQSGKGSTIHRNFWSVGASSDNLMEGSLTVNGTLTNGSTVFPTSCAVSTLVYASSANNLACLATANNGVVITGSSGIPSISSTIPSATQDNITRTGTVTSGTWGSAISSTSTSATGSAFGLTDASLAPAAAATGSVLGLTYTNISTNSSGTSTVAGLTITPTVNVTSGAGTHNTIGINFAALTATACGAGTCNKYAIYYPASSNFTDLINYNGTSILGATGLLNLASVTGTLSNANGGTGVSAAAVTDGQILIGKTSDHTLNLATITQGTGITVTNGAGTITIAASGGGLTGNPAVEATTQTDQSFNSTAAFVTFESENYDTDTMHSTAGGSNTKLTSTTAGDYHYTFAAQLSSNPGNVFIMFRKNGTTLVCGSGGVGSATSIIFSASCDYNMAATDYMEVSIECTGGCTNLHSNARFDPVFSAFLMSK